MGSGGLFRLHLAFLSKCRFLSKKLSSKWTKIQRKWISLGKGAIYETDGKTNEFLWIEAITQEFADSFINQYGLLITSDSCSSKETKDDVTDGGIGYMLRRIVAEKAKSAREAVKTEADYGHMRKMINQELFPAEKGFIESKKKSEAEISALYSKDKKEALWRLTAYVSGSFEKNKNSYESILKKYPGN